VKWEGGGGITAFPQVREFKGNDTNEVTVEVPKVQEMQCEIRSRAGARIWFCPFI